MEKNSAEPLLTLSIEGKDVSVYGLLIDRISNQPKPWLGSDAEWRAFEEFVTSRAQNSLGEWPVYVVKPASDQSADTRFDGFRVFARCSRISEINCMEYAILVWHEPQIKLHMQFPSELHSDIPWSRFAERTEV